MLESKFAAIEPYRPLCAGHRGFKALYPENSISAMEAAISAGATIIETDIQVAGDGTIIVSHDPNTLRCFGVDYDITRTPYKGVLEDLRTPDKFQERIPTFLELAQLFASSAEFSGTQLMLDIKRTNEPEIIEGVFEVLKSVNPDIEGFWKKRMVLGIWRWDVLQAAERVCPMLPVVHIGFSRTLARRFLDRPQTVGISMHFVTLNVPGGQAIIDYARVLDKLVYCWTVNDLEVMKWAITSKLDGIITDDPLLYTQFIKSISQDDIERVYSSVAPQSFFTLYQKIMFHYLFLTKHLVLWWDRLLFSLNQGPKPN